MQWECISENTSLSYSVLGICGNEGTNLEVKLKGGICLDHQGIIEFVLIELFAPEKEVVEPVEVASLPCWFWFWKGFCKKLPMFAPGLL